MLLDLAELERDSGALGSRIVGLQYSAGLVIQPCKHLLPRPLLLVFSDTKIHQKRFFLCMHLVSSTGVAP